MKIGDVVMLKSGGPTMTALVESSDGDGHPVWIRCAWFEGDSVRERNFPEDALVRDSLSIEPTREDAAVFIAGHEQRIGRAVRAALAEGKGPHVVAAVAKQRLHCALRAVLRRDAKPISGGKE